MPKRKLTSGNSEKGKKAKKSVANEGIYNKDLLFSIISLLS